jgi:wyosine [tRNA(Phe)-imidazoG37] synthetase (radical SAM superfamily)
MNSDFTSVYGPVRSWRYGLSLGIDPIGLLSTCSFDCVYCQLGAIEVLTQKRQVFIPTDLILQELAAVEWQSLDIVTLSGSGEPTLALNLGEILAGIKTLTGHPCLVLTNATLLGDRQVRLDLALADKVAVKLDAVTSDQMRRINRPVPGLELSQIVRGIQTFRQQFGGELAVQTMVLQPWSETEKRTYQDLMAQIQPQEIQLNTPSRPKPQQRQLAGRGNEGGNYATQRLKCVEGEVLLSLAQELGQQTGIRVRCAPGR